MNLLNAKAWGATIATLAGLCWLVGMSMALLMGGWFEKVVKWMGQMHPWFSYSWLGMIWMIVLHVVVGFIFGWIFASVYNMYARRLK